MRAGPGDDHAGTDRHAGHGHDRARPTAGKLTIAPIRRLPDLVSALRIACALALVPAAYGRHAGAFWLLLVAGLVSDAADGFLARRWGVTSERGRRLDSAGDYVLVAALVPSVFLLWPALVRRELPWFGLALGAYFLPTIWSLVRWRTVPALHTRASKAAAVAMAVALLVLLLGGSPLPFRVMAVVQLAVMAEELAIIRVRNGRSGAVSSYRHARDPAPDGGVAGEGPPGVDSAA